MVTEISQNNTTQIVSLRGAITQHIHHIQVTFFSTKITPMQMLCDNEMADLMDIEITTSTVTGCFMFYKKCFNTWNTLYLGFPESKERGLSGSELGTLLTFSVPAPARGFRWNASSIFSTWINCPPSPRSAMNLKEKRAKVRVKLMSMFQCFRRDIEIKMLYN